MVFSLQYQPSLLWLYQTVLFLYKVTFTSVQNMALISIAFQKLLSVIHGDLTPIFLLFKTLIST